MHPLFLAPFAAQAAVMLVDEGVHHRRRRLPRWERIGHPLDTLTTTACYAWLLVAPPSRATGAAYIALAVFSCLFVTKDEIVHQRVCTRAECWLHALLFVVHPVVLALFGLAWFHGDVWLVRVQLALTIALASYQVVYWNVVRRVRA